jgi:hypothetical protein
VRAELQHAPYNAPEGPWLHAIEGPIRHIVAASEHEAWNKLDDWGKRAH